MGVSYRVDLVRHADAVDRGSWQAPDWQRPLSARGDRQAAELVALLGEPPGTLVYSSPAVRCQQTVQPIAVALATDVQNDPRLAEGSSSDQARRFIETAEQNMVLCSHGDVIGFLIFDLVNDGLAPREARFQKASTWRFECNGGRIVSAEYLAPP